MSYKRAGDRVYEMIRQRILSREWQPGMKIMSEPQLVKEFGVSRVSVREAIEKLAALGVLKKVQGDGTYVREINNTEFVNDLLPLLTLEHNNFKEVLEFRKIFEPSCARMCAEHADEDLLARLRECYARMCAFDGQREEFSTADAEFHLLVAEGSRNPLLHKMHLVFMPVLKMHQCSLYSSLSGKDGIKDHLKLIEVISARDGELSELYARRHVQRTINDMMRRAAENETS